MTYAAITGWGKCMPPSVLTNADLATFLDTDDEWIASRTGMRERRISHVSAIEMATVAGQRALACAGLDAAELDLIVYGSCSNDEQVPNSASGVQIRLGAARAAAMDLNTACTSFLYGLVQCDRADPHRRRAQCAGDRCGADLAVHGLGQPQCGRAVRRRLRGRRAASERARRRGAGAEARLLCRCAPDSARARHGLHLCQPGRDPGRHPMGFRRAGNLQARGAWHGAGQRRRAGRLWRDRRRHRPRGATPGQFADHRVRGQAHRYPAGARDAHGAALRQHERGHRAGALARTTTPATRAAATRAAPRGPRRR